MRRILKRVFIVAVTTTAVVGCGSSDDGATTTDAGTIGIGGVLEAAPGTDAPATSAAPSTTEEQQTTVAPTTEMTTSTTEPAPAPFTFVGAIGDAVGEPTSEPMPSPTGGQRVTDATGRLSLRVPAEWIDRSTEAGELDDGTAAPYVAASPALRRFLDGYDAPGMTVVVMPPSDDLTDALDSYRFGEACIDAGLYDFENGELAGQYQVWMDCGDTATDIVTVVAAPPDDSYNAVILAQILTDADLASLDRALASLRVRRS